MTSKTILITGANRGIGFSIVHRLAKLSQDANYLLAVRSRDAGEEAVRQLGQHVTGAKLEVLELDVTNDEHIKSAVETVTKKYGKLDVLINNAGIAAITTEDTSIADLRTAYNDVFNTNVTSIAALTTAFLPLLRRSSDPRVIFISSGRASMTALTTHSLPPTVSVPYSISKLAMNVLMIELTKQEQATSKERGSEILFQAVNPGHCKTSFNGFKGKRDPFEGAKVVEELVFCDRAKWASGFWTWEGNEESGKMREVPW